MKTTEKIWKNDKQPVKSLLEFQQRHYPDAPLDSPFLVIKLLEKIVEKIRGGKNGK